MRYATKITPDFLKIAVALDPQINELKPTDVSNHYLVADDNTDGRWSYMIVPVETIHSEIDNGKIYDTIELNITKYEN